MRLFDISRISIIRMVQAIKRNDLVSKKDSNEDYNIDQRSCVKLISKNGKTKFVCSSSLKKGDIIEISDGQIIPFDGEIIEGCATVDESALTGESPYVIREAGGDLNKVIGGTKVISNSIRIRIISITKPILKEEYPDNNKTKSKVKLINLGI